MQDKIKLLAQEAGFCFFTPEEDAEEPIDWSCDYEQEFKVFADLLQKQTRKDTIEMIMKLLHGLHELSKNNHNYYGYAANLVEKHFKELHENIHK